MTPVLRTVPAVIASLLVGAHFLRGGEVLPAVAVGLAPLLLLARRNWAVRVVQGVLAAAVVVWLHTLVILTAARRAEGVPFVRMAIILGVVALVTAFGAIALEPLASRFRHTTPPPEET